MEEPAHVLATRTAYDTVAFEYAELLKTDLATKPLERGLLTAFAELVRQAGEEPIVDVGCGPGRITHFLDSTGIAAFGVDLSPAMVAVARWAYPDLRFEVGSMSALDLADDSVAGIVAWYSIIHTPPAQLPQVFREFARVLRPGGQLLLAFQVGDEQVHVEHGYGQSVSLDAYRLLPERVADLLGAAQLFVHARVIRDPVAPEKVQQAYLLARQGSGSAG